MTDKLNAARPPERRLIYLIGTFPSLTTTFIDREVRTLRRWGVDVQVVAMRRPPDDLPLSAEQEACRQGVIYLFPMVWLQLIAAHVYFALRHPRRLFSALAYLMTRPHPDWRTWLKSLLHFAEGVYSAYLIRKQSFRELHAHFADRAATIALVAGRLLDKPYSLSLHAGADIYVSPVLLREKVLGARHVVTCTRFNKTHIERLIGQSLDGQMSYVKHGLELAKYHPPNGSTNGHPTNGRPIILSVGQLAERKGLDQLIRSCGDLRDQGYKFACHIVGQGPRRPQLEALIDQLQLNEMVTLHGALPHEAVIDHYRRATMFVLPCLQTKDGDVDGIPNVLAEAMAMQLPVVSTNLSAIPELVHDGQNGLLVPPEDMPALSGAVARLLKQPELCKELGRNGRRSVLETFDVEQNVRRFAATLWPDWFGLPS